jgi:hypothetical protein
MLFLWIMAGLIWVLNYFYKVCFDLTEHIFVHTMTMHFTCFGSLENDLPSLSSILGSQEFGLWSGNLISKMFLCNLTTYFFKKNIQIVLCSEAGQSFLSSSGKGSPRISTHHYSPLFVVNFIVFFCSSVKLNSSHVCRMSVLYNCFC